MHGTVTLSDGSLGLLGLEFKAAQEQNSFALLDLFEESCISRYELEP